MSVSYLSVYQSIQKTFRSSGKNTNAFTFFFNSGGFMSTFTRVRYCPMNKKQGLSMNMPPDVLHWTALAHFIYTNSIFYFRYQR